MCSATDDRLLRPCAGPEPEIVQPALERPKLGRIHTGFVRVLDQVTGAPRQSRHSDGVLIWLRRKKGRKIKYVRSHFSFAHLKKLKR